jgi:hypothetical protein
VCFVTKAPPDPAQWEPLPHDAKLMWMSLELMIRETNRLFVRNCRAGWTCGIARGYPTHNPEPDKLLKLADAAMYSSKRSGGNQVSIAEITWVVSAAISRRRKTRKSDRTFPSQGGGHATPEVLNSSQL